MFYTPPVSPFVLVRTNNIVHSAISRRYVAKKTTYQSHAVASGSPDNIGRTKFRRDSLPVSHSLTGQSQYRHEKTICLFLIA